MENEGKIKKFGDKYIDDKGNIYMVIRRISKPKEINGQIFFNSMKYGYDSKHQCRSFYNKLKNNYCKHRGFKICDKWLDYQEFCKWWDEHKEEGKKVIFNQEYDEINEESVYFQ